MTITFALICAGLGFAIAGGFAAIVTWLQPSVLATEIEQSIRAEPKRWKHEYDFKRDDGLSLRSKSGRGCLYVREPKDIRLGYADRRLIWRAYQEHKNNMTVSDLMGAAA